MIFVRRGHCSADRTPSQLREVSLSFFPFHSDVLSCRPLREYHWTIIAGERVGPRLLLWPWLASSLGSICLSITVDHLSDYLRACALLQRFRDYSLPQKIAVHSTFLETLLTLFISRFGPPRCCSGLGNLPNRWPTTDRRRCIFWLAGNRRRVALSRGPLSCGDSVRRGSFCDRKAGAKIGSYFFFLGRQITIPAHGLGRPRRATQVVPMSINTPASTS